MTFENNFDRWVNTSVRGGRKKSQNIVRATVATNGTNNEEENFTTNDSISNDISRVSGENDEEEEVLNVEKNKEKIDTTGK